jgi:transcriptional regulator with XRE-family HTH domain
MQLRLRTLGDTLRTLRVERGYSIGEVAAGTDLSTSFLSLLENGRSDISTGRLFRVARFLGIGLGDLLEMDAPRELTVVRADERRSVEMPGDGLSMFPVVNDHDDVAMAPVICEYEVGAHVHDAPRMEGVEHFVFVVRGEIAITHEAAEPLLLNLGDCAYFRSERPCEVRNAGDERSVTIWVSSPPAFGGSGRR